MPKITAKSWYIDGELLTFDICYTQKLCFHVKDFPKHVTTVAGKGGMDSFKTEEALYAAVRETLEDYHVKVKKTRKVIAYSITASAELAMNKTPYEGGGMSYSGSKEWVPKSLQRMIHENRDGGFGFAISYSVLMEVKDAHTCYYELGSHNQKAARTAYVHNRIVIDWTQEREEAFEEIKRGMENMLKRITAVMGDTDSMKKWLDSGTKLIPETTEREAQPE